MCQPLRAVLLAAALCCPSTASAQTAAGAGYDPGRLVVYVGTGVDTVEAAADTEARRERLRERLRAVRENLDTDGRGVFDRAYTAMRLVKSDEEVAWLRARRVAQ